MRVKSRDFAITVICFLQGSTLITIIFTSKMKWESWIPTLAGIAAGTALVWVYASLAESHKGKNLIDINYDVFGNGAGRVISCLYILYFAFLTAFNTDHIGSFFADYIMSETPKAVFFIMILAVCGLAVRSGIENIIRMGFVLLAIAILMLASNILLLANKIDFQNFLPLFTHGFSEYVQCTHTSIAVPFGEVVVFLMFADIVEDKNLKKGFIIGFVLGALSVLLVILRDIAVLGVAISVISVPSYEALRLIDISNILTRLEILLSFNMVIMTFVKIAVLYAATVRGAAQVTGSKKEKNLVWSIGIILLCLSVLGFESGFQESEYGRDYHAFLATPFVIILPLVTFAADKIRRRKAR